MRFGIGVDTDHTLVEAGQQFSLTREHIRQIEARAQRGERKFFVGDTFLGCYWLEPFTPSCV